MSTYKVSTSSSSLNVRSGPGTKYKVIGTLAKGTACSGTVSNGWIKFSNGPYSGKYASATYLKLIKETKSATKASNSSGKENTEAVATADYKGNTNANLKTEHYKAVNALGCPPMYNQYTDLQYIDDVAPGVGRVFASTMLSNPTILSICPGKVDYLPGFSNKNKTEFLQMVKDLAKGDSDLTGLIADNVNGVNGKLYEFKADYKNYINVVNCLCRMQAIYMGIGDEKFPHTNIKYKYFDYGYVTVPNGAAGSNSGNIFKSTAYNIGQAFSTAVNDTNYIHFFVTHQGTSLSENISTSTTAGALESIFGGESEISSAARNIQFLLGGTVNGDEMTNDVANLLKGNDSFITSLGSLAANYLKGGRLVFPQMIEDVQYEKSFSCTCKFVSPYGNKESIFLRCYMPAMFLLAMSLPKQISDNMYTYPFLTRVFQKGYFNTDLSVISNLQLTRGGSDETAWTVDGLSTELEARFDVTPLYSRLMATNCRNPFLFLQNTALIEYLATMAGVDLKDNNLTAKMNIARSLIVSKVSPTDNLANLSRGIGDKITNNIAKWFQIQNM